MVVYSLFGAVAENEPQQAAGAHDVRCGERKESPSAEQLRSI